ncbi:MAG: hypothetical protein AB7E95_11800 [Kiritimatiellales bacterium]
MGRLKKKLIISAVLVGWLTAHSTVLVEEHFSTAADTAVGDVPGWTTVAKFEDQPVVNPRSQLLTGGRSYGTTITGIDVLKSTAQDGYVYNSAGRVANLITTPLSAPIDFSEGSTLYFSALVSGVNRASFGLGNVPGTNYPDQLLLIGVQPQISSTETTPKDFGSAVWLGDLTQVHDNTGIAISGDLNTIHLIIGKIVNNAAGTDEISYHVIDITSSVNIPSVWTDSALTGEVGYYSRTNYDFGGDLVLSNLFVNLQNNGGLDEIYIGTSYPDVIQSRILHLFFISLNEKQGEQVSLEHSI